VTAIRTIDLVAGALLLAATAGVAAQSTVRDVMLVDLAKAIDRPLPSPELAPGILPRRAPSGLVVVGGFNEMSGLCEQKALGNAFAQLLRVEAWGLSPSISFAHPVSQALDEAPGSRHEDGTGFARVLKRTGADRWISGEIERDAGHYILSVTLNSNRSRTPIFTGQTPLSAIHVTASQIAESLVEALNGEIPGSERFRLRALREHGALAFEDLVSAYVAEHCGARAPGVGSFRDAWAKHPSYPTAAALYASTLRRNLDYLHVIDELSRVAALADAHPVVQLEALTYLGRLSRNASADEQLPRVTEIAARYPQEPYALLTLADLVGGVSLIYRYETPYEMRPPVMSGPIDHHPREARALALLIRAAELWPDYYYSWWYLATQVDSYTFSIRGSGAWRSVPETARVRWTPLYDSLNRIVHRALRLHSGVDSLYRVLMGVDLKQGRDWTRTFYFAAEIVPQHPGLYVAATVYAQPGWGGSAKLRRDIYLLAARNNPDASWPEEMFRAWSPTREHFWILNSRAIVAVVVVAVFAWMFARRRKRQQ
jgi:hypothetical protein